jgi:hypothetical protein
MGGTERRAQEVRISVSLQEVPGFKLGTEIWYSDRGFLWFYLSPWKKIPGVYEN